MGDGESAHDSPREEALQNISADDLPDSASQAAHPQDSAFSYRFATLQVVLFSFGLIWFGLGLVLVLVLETGFLCVALAVLELTL
jgi:hypothetical protein